jgi:hypothetical protein
VPSEEPCMRQWETLTEVRKEGVKEEGVKEEGVS